MTTPPAGPAESSDEERRAARRAARRADAAKKVSKRARRAAKRRRRRLRAVFWLKVTRAVVRPLPMSVACLLGHGLGVAAWWISGYARRQSLEHLAIAFPEKSPRELTRIGRRSFGLLGRGMFAFVVAHRMGAQRAMKFVRVEDASGVTAALAEGKGLLLVTFHFGCFELLASQIGTLYRGRAVGREADEGGPTELLIEMRRDLGCETIQRGAPLDLIRTLRENRPVAMLVDQDTSDVKGAFVPFFGRLAHTPTGPAALAVRTGTPIVMGFIEWEGLTRHHAFTLPVMRPRDDLPRDDAVLELTARMTKAGEDVVRRRPDHWVWIHRRWQARPEDHPEEPVYPGVPK